MKPIYQYLIAFILLISIGITGYFLGRNSKDCPKIDAPILPPENDTIKNLIAKLAILETENINLKKRKHEIKVIYKTDTVNPVSIDTFPIKPIFKQWANYYGK